MLMLKPNVSPHPCVTPKPSAFSFGLYLFNFSSNRRRRRDVKGVVGFDARGVNCKFQAVKDNRDAAAAASGVGGTEAVASSGSSKKGLTASFGKLKAQKVKAIARKASHIKPKFGLDLEGLENGVHQMSDSDRAGSQDVPVPGGTASSFRGWGNGGSIHGHESKSVDPLRGRRKFLAENDFFSRKSFRELGCREFMIQSLKEQGILRPSHIQALAFAAVSAGKSCVISDQSGSGKTLAYLIPVIQRLRQEELQGLSDSPLQGPKILIMVPTAELASQVLSDCRSMSKFGVPFRSMVVTGGFRQRTQTENLEQAVDVLIATPGRFMFLINEGHVELTNIRCVVLDEVDILFINEDFEAVIQSLINSSPVSTQYLFVTATLPVDAYNKLIESFPDCEVIMGPGMHRTSNGLQEVLVDCSGENGTEKTPESAFLNKKTALLQLMEQSPVSKTIVFCNKEWTSCSSSAISCCSSSRNTTCKYEGVHEFFI
uniref:DEAD-box ATP-dependent RNA helicase 50 n=1 Tax=Rhizophora mucronata TaxID=61149 RepID=A0A2P2L3F9_RHIMU